MITLTEKETLLAQELLDTNDDSNAHICSEDWIDIKKLNFSIDTLKGVFGSLVQKDLLDYCHTNENFEILQMVEYSEYEITSVDELLEKERRGVIMVVLKTLLLQKNFQNNSIEYSIRILLLEIYKICRVTITVDAICNSK